MTDGGSVESRAGSDRGADNGDAKREQLNVLTQETRFVLVENILAHPAQLPSLKELDYYNPSKSKSTIRNHLETLIESGLVEKCKLPDDERTRDLPSTFYGLTERARTLLEESGLAEGEETLQEMYELLELTDEIERYAAAPRPEQTADSDPLRDLIQSSKSNTESVDDQIQIARTLFEQGIDSNHEGITRQELGDLVPADLSYRPKTSLGHLEDVGLVETVTPTGPNVYAISERLDEIINGRVTDVAAEDLERLISHMEDEIYSVDMSDVEQGDVVAVADGAGTTIRALLAEEMTEEPEDVESYLRAGDPVEKLNWAIDTIEESDYVESGSEYGRILFRHPANRYRLTAAAEELFDQSS